jgi:hypothetical protein
MAAAVIDVVDYYADHAQPHWKIAIVNKTLVCYFSRAPLVLI